MSGKNEKLSWYLENIVSGAKIKIPEGQVPHHILDSFHSDEKKNWCLKCGPLEERDVGGTFETSLLMPDGTSQYFIDDSISTERRAFPRLEMQLKVTLIAGRRIFRTTTKNISLGGLSLEAPPPRDYTHPDLKILIENSSGTLRLLLRSDFIATSGQKRMKFLELKEIDIELLSKLLEEAPSSSQKIAA